MVSPSESEEGGGQENTAVRQGFPCLRIAFLLLVIIFGIAILSPLRGVLLDEARGLVREWRVPEAMIVENEERVFNSVQESLPDVVESAVVESVNEVPSSMPEEVETEEVIAVPIVPAVSSGGDVRKLARGVELKTHVEIIPGKRAALERKKDSSFSASYRLTVTLPEPAKTIDELEAVNPNLSKLLPGLTSMMNGAKVSHFYHTLYKNKVERLKRNATNLAELTTRHNFFDCETILTMKDASSGRKVLLMQGDMDVVSDGSDGDRMEKMPDEIVNSTHYQPFTSYGWKKRTKKPNPMIEGWKKRVANADSEIAQDSTTEARRSWLVNRKKMLLRGIEDMTHRSFLIAEHDPFIVLPVNMLTDSRDPYAGRAGDYAVVIYGDKIYPAIVGDGGPTFKVGEASLRMAKRLNPSASSYSRPVSDLTVTYLVFSNSRDKVKQPPNYEAWRERCGELIGEIGGLGDAEELESWVDHLAPAVLEQAESREEGE